MPTGQNRAANSRTGSIGVNNRCDALVLDGDEKTERLERMIQQEPTK